MTGVADITKDPAFADAVRDITRPLIQAAARATTQRVLSISPGTQYAKATVLTVDHETGTAELHVDGDPDGASTSALIVGPPPPPGARCEVMFTPDGQALTFGTIGIARVVLPTSGPVSIESDDHPFQVGDTDGLNLAVDGSTIQARDGGNGRISAMLGLNPSGGLVEIAGRLKAGRLINPTSGDAANGAFLAYSDRFDQKFWQQRFNSDGNVYINASHGATFFVIDAYSGTFPPDLILSVARVAGQTDMRAPLPLLGGTAPLGLVPATGQIGTSSSSARYKMQVRDADPVALLAIARRLRPVRFRYRLHDVVADAGVDAHISPNYGLIAEEVADVAPEVVCIDAEGRPDALDPNGLVGVLVGAVQALASHVEALSARVAELEGTRPEAAGPVPSTP